MPEGDIVWRAARRLDRALAGRTLLRSELRVPRHATADLVGTLVLGTDTHGKNLFTRFDSGLTLHTHLRMDGAWVVLRPGKRPPRSLFDDIRVLLESDQHHIALALRIPVVELMRTADEARVTGALGPDPLRADWDPVAAVHRLAENPGRPVAAALLDQRLMAGLGNLWVNELLFVRGHSPWTPVDQLDLDKLVTTGARMLQQSIRMRGNGQVTTGDPRRGNEHWVYRRSGQPCRRCGTQLRYVPAVSGDPERRATWWCPYCQPGPEPG